MVSTLIIALARGADGEEIALRTFIGEFGIEGSFSPVSEVLAGHVGACAAGYRPSCVYAGGDSPVLAPRKSERIRFAESCGEGDRLGCLVTGWLYSDDGLAMTPHPDADTARLAFERACEMGLARACMEAVSAARFGYAVQQQAAAGRPALEAACEAGDGAACFAASWIGAQRGRRPEAEQASGLVRGCALAHADSCELLASVEARRRPHPAMDRACGLRSPTACVATAAGMLDADAGLARYERAIAIAGESAHDPFWSAMELAEQKSRVAVGTRRWRSALETARSMLRLRPGPYDGRESVAVAERFALEHALGEGEYRMVEEYLADAPGSIDVGLAAVELAARSGDCRSARERLEATRAGLSATSGRVPTVEAALLEGWVEVFACEKQPLSAVLAGALPTRTRAAAWRWSAGVDVGRTPSRRARARAERLASALLSEPRGRAALLEELWLVRNEHLDRPRGPVQSGLPADLRRLMRLTLDALDGGGATRDEFGTNRTLDELLRATERAETRASMGNDDFRQRVTPVTVERVAARLGKRGVVVEYFEHRPPARAARLGACVLDAGGRTRCRDLAALAEVEGATRAFLSARGATPEADRLGAMVLAPLSVWIGRAGVVHVAPEGPLHLVPMGSVSRRRGHRLLESALVVQHVGSDELLWPRAAAGGAGVRVWGELGDRTEAVLLGRKEPADADDCGLFHDERAGRLSWGHGGSSRQNGRELVVPAFESQHGWLGVELRARECSLLAFARPLDVGDDDLATTRMAAARRALVRNAGSAAILPLWDSPAGADAVLADAYERMFGGMPAGEALRTAQLRASGGAFGVELTSPENWAQFSYTGVEDPLR